MRTTKGLNLILALAITSITAYAQTNRDSEPEVRSVIGRFETALQRHDLNEIETLVAPDIVVFENGRRNDGWQDFRDNHLVPQFKASATRYASDIVKVEATPLLSWAYSRMNRAYARKAETAADVWAVYVLRKSDKGWKITMLDWSVRRVE